MKKVIKSKIAKAISLEERDLVYANGEYGIVVLKGKTFLHGHKFVNIEWMEEDGCNYIIKYLIEDNKIVEKIFAILGVNE